MQIRDTIEDDAYALTDLIDRVCRERKYLAATMGFPAAATRDFIASIRRTSGVHIIALADGELIGWCDIVPRPFEGMKHSGQLGMGVAKEHRHRGIGRMLLSAAIDRAFSLGLERIELEVFASNHAAVRLYENTGFVAEGRKIAARKLDGGVDDVLLYAKPMLA